MSDKPSDKLLPCPFCGGEARVHVTYETELVTCTKCGCRTETIVGDYYDEGFMDGSRAIKKWNTRKPMELIVERLIGASYWTQQTFDDDGFGNDDSEQAIDLYEAIEIVKEEIRN